MYVCVCVYVGVYIEKNLYVCKCIYTYVYIYTHMYIHIHTYIYIYLLNRTHSQSQLSQDPIFSRTETSDFNPCDRKTRRGEPKARSRKLLPNPTPSNTNAEGNTLQKAKAIRLEAESLPPENPNASTLLCPQGPAILIQEP